MAEFTILPKSYFEIINAIQDSYMIYNRSIELDRRFMDPNNYKLDKMGNLVNTWCLLSTTENPDLTNKSEYPEDFDYVLIFGVNIKLSKTPIIIETLIKGFDSPVFQQFANNCFDINISFLETGPIFFQQNVKQLKKLVKILDSNQTLFISNPLLNYTYNVNKVICTSYEIGQDDRLYTHTPITLTLKSDKDKDIIQKTTSIK